MRDLQPILSDDGSFVLGDESGARPSLLDDANLPPADSGTDPIALFGPITASTIECHAPSDTSHVDNICGANLAASDPASQSAVSADTIRSDSSQSIHITHPDISMTTPTVPNSMILQYIGSTNEVQLFGAADAGDTITIYDGASKIATSTAGSTGYWYYDISPNLSTGLHTLTATATNSSGTSAPSAPLTDLVGSSSGGTLTATVANEYIDISQGGTDTVNCGNYPATILAGTAFTAADTIVAGTGSVFLALNGNYSSPLVLGSSTLQDVYGISESYGTVDELVLNAATIASGRVLFVDGYNGGNITLLDATAQTTGTLDVYEGSNGGTVELGGGTANVNIGTETDTITCGSGTDTIYGFNSSDTITGGSGTSTLVIGAGFNNLNLVQNISDIGFNSTSGSYTITLYAGNLTSGHTMEINGSSLATDSQLTVFGDAQTTGDLNILADNSTATIQLGSGSDSVTLGSGGGQVHADGTGSYAITGGSGAITVYFANQFTAADSVVGGSNGMNEVELDGGGNVVMGADTLENIQTLGLAGGYNYNLTLNADTIEAGQTLTIMAGNLESPNILTVDASAQTAGTLDIDAGFAPANITLGGGTSNVYFGSGTITGGSGPETIYVAGQFNASDSIIGGNSGSNEVELDGGANVVMAADTLQNIQKLYLDPYSNAYGYFSYSLTLNAATIGSGQTMTIAGGSLTSSNSLTVDATAQTTGTLNIQTGGAPSTITLGGGTANVMLGAATDAVHAVGSGTYGVTGDSGSATVYFNGQFDAADSMVGGSGAMVVELNGNYTGANAVVFGASTMKNVSKLYLAPGNSYNLTLNSHTLSSGYGMTIAGSGLLSTDVLTLNAAAIAAGTLDIMAGNSAATLTLGGGTENVTLGSGTDAIHCSGAGTYTIADGSGSDTIYFNGGFKAADTITGGSRTNVVELNGNYTGANAVTMNASTLTNIQTLYLAPGNSYNLTLNSHTIASGQTMKIAGSGLLSGDVLTLNDSAQTAGTVNIFAGDSAATITLGGGTENVTLGSGIDALHCTGAGTYTITDGSGSDTIYFNGGFKAADSITGSSGTSIVELNGNYTGADAVTMSASTLTNIQTLYLAGGNSYDLTLNAATVTSGHTMKVAAQNMEAGDALTLDASATAGAVTVNLGAGTNVITGGTGPDTFNAGTGTDIFVFTSTTDMTAGTNYDTIAGLQFATAHFRLDFSVGAINAAVTAGSLSTATFQSDLAHDLTSLGAHDAVLFTPNAGTLAGQTFLVVDVNGTAGYQAGQDLVIHLTGANGTLTTSDFLT